MEIEKRILSHGHNTLNKMSGEKAAISFPPENKIQHESIDQLPELTRGENSVRYDQFTGEIFISSWRSKNDQNNEKIKYLRWSKFSDINLAIRSCQHVSQKHESGRGEANEKIQGTIGFVRSTLSDFRAKRYDKDNFSYLSDSTADYLKDTGFTNSKKAIRVAIADQIEKAANLDSRGRFNPLISRTRLASSWLKLMRELTVNKGIYDKYQRLTGQLMLEQYFEASSLDNMGYLIDEILNIYGNSRFSTDLQNKILVNQLEQAVSENLNFPNIRVNPYLRPATIVRNILFANTSDKQNISTLRTQVADDTKTLQIMALKPLQQLHSTTSAEEFYSEFSHRLRVCSSSLKI